MGRITKEDCSLIKGFARGEAMGRQTVGERISKQTMVSVKHHSSAKENRQ